MGLVDWLRRRGDGERRPAPDEASAEPTSAPEEEWPEEEQPEGDEDDPTVYPLW
jgi:hypothetical protein